MNELRTFIGTALLLTVAILPIHAATPLDAVVVQDGFGPSGLGADFRVLNAAPGVGPIDFYIAQNREAEDVAFEEITAARQITAASYAVRVFPAGEVETPLLETVATFGQLAEFVLALSGTADDLELITLESSSPGPSPSSAYVRFVHLSPDAGSMDLAIAGGEILHSDIGYRQQSDFFELTNGVYDLEVRPAGEAVVKVPITGVWLRGTRFHTVYLTGLEADEGEEDSEFTTFVAAASRNSGLAGSFWVTTLDVLNHGVEAAAFHFKWLPRGADNSEPAESEEYVVPAGQSYRFDDVLAEAFGVGDEGANGALIVVADSDEVSAFARIFNLTDIGTYGQAMPGLDPDELVRAGEVKRILFMTEDDAFRSNLGILNTTASPIRVVWRTFLGDGTMWGSSYADLPPYGNIQRNRIFKGAEPLAGGYVEIRTETFNGRFVAYGSVLDNRTSDPTTVLPD